MPRFVLRLLFAALTTFGAICLPASYRNDSTEERAEQVSLGSGWHDPRVNGGRMLDFTTRHLGEPLNVIISGHSDPFILTEAGFHYYAKSIGFAEECLGLHYGKIHHADLGDGNYRMEEQFLARQHYFPVWGTCWESVAGGNHFRAWKQDGPLANSGAWFLGVSKEEDSSKNHMIVDDGYNLGRDWLVEKAIAGSHLNGMWWRAEVVWNENDLLHPGRHGINHGIAQDGDVHRDDSISEDFSIFETYMFCGPWHLGMHF